MSEVGLGWVGTPHHVGVGKQVVVMGAVKGVRAAAWLAGHTKLPLLPAACRARLTSPAANCASNSCNQTVGHAARSGTHKSTSFIRSCR